MFVDRCGCQIVIGIVVYRNRPHVALRLANVLEIIISYFSAQGGCVHSIDLAQNTFLRHSG